MTPPPKDAEEKMRAEWIKHAVEDNYYENWDIRHFAEEIADWFIPRIASETERAVKQLGAQVSAQDDKKLNELVRDATKVGIPMPKSEMRRRIGEIVASESARVRDEMLDAESAMFEEGRKAERKILAEEILRLPSTFIERESDDYDEGMTYMKNRILQLIREDQSK